jgi:serine/threonine protein kinase
MDFDRRRKLFEKPVLKPAATEVVPKKVRYECAGTEYLIDEHYELVKQIGVGAYGFVASGVNKLTGQKVAIKKVHNAFSDLIDAKRILREIKLLKFFDHPNVISITDLMRPESKNYRDVYIVT